MINHDDSAPSSRAFEENLIGLTVLEKQDKYTVITIDITEMDIEQIALWGHVISREIEQSRAELILDISHVKYMDSAALGSLVEFRNALKATNRRLFLVAPMPMVAQILTITSLHEIVWIVASIEEAKAAIATGTQSERQ